MTGGVKAQEEPTVKPQRIDCIWQSTARRRFQLNHLGTAGGGPSVHKRAHCVESQLPPSFSKATTHSTWPTFPTTQRDQTWTSPGTAITRTPKRTTRASTETKSRRRHWGTTDTSTLQVRDHAKSAILRKLIAMEDLQWTARDLLVMVLAMVGSRGVPPWLRRTRTSRSSSMR